MASYDRVPHIAPTRADRVEPPQSPFPAVAGSLIRSRQHQIVYRNPEEWGEDRPTPEWAQLDPIEPLISRDLDDAYEMDDFSVELGQEFGEDAPIGAYFDERGV